MDGKDVKDWQFVNHIDVLEVKHGTNALLSFKDLKYVNDVEIEEGGGRDDDNDAQMAKSRYIHAQNR